MLPVLAALPVKATVAALTLAPGSPVALYIDTFSRFHLKPGRQKLKCPPRHQHVGDGGTPTAGVEVVGSHVALKTHRRTVGVLQMPLESHMHQQPRSVTQLSGSRASRRGGEHRHRAITHSGQGSSALDGTGSEP